MITQLRTTSAGSAAVRKKQKKGFTLTEIAIVLGIVGLILGAIWVAAAAVYNNLRSSKATTELLTVVQNVRALYATSGIVNATADMAINGPNAGATATYLQAGIFPSDTLNNPNVTLATEALDPWNGTISVVSAQTNTAGDSFTVVLDKVPQQACITILTSNVGQGRDPGMTGAGAGVSGAKPGNAAGSTTFATSNMVTTSATTAQTQCTNNPNAVGFTFLVK